jgi:hypothetical protein
MPSRALAFALSLLLLAALLPPPGAAAAPTAQATPCPFVHGFAQLRSMIGPAVVGDCLENERPQRNGDMAQRTTKGMLVWRKFDNVTAFTDGHRTWLNGPKGLQSRLNTDLLDWERQEVADELSKVAKRNPCTPAMIELSLVSYDPPTGPRNWHGTLTSRCPVRVDVVIDVVGRSKAGDDKSESTGELASVVVQDADPNEPVQVTVPKEVQAPHYSWSVLPVPEDAELICLDVGASRCLASEGLLAASALALLEDPEGAALVRRAAEGGIGLLRGPLGPRLSGAYAPKVKLAAVSTRYDRSTRWVRAAVLVHELQHAVDNLEGRIPSDGAVSEASCYEAEVRAFQAEARVWRRLWAGKAAPDNRLHYREQNRVAAAIASDPAEFVSSVEATYEERCQHIAAESAG